MESGQASNDKLWCTYKLKLLPVFHTLDNHSMWTIKMNEIRNLQEMCDNIYLPMNRYCEDGPDVGQHCLKVLWVLLEAHLRQNHRLIDVLEGKRKHRNDQRGK